MARRICTILPIVLLLSMGLHSLQGSVDERALAKPWPRPLSDAPWSANVRVNDDAGTERQEVPAIAVDSSGNAYAMWYDWRNSNWDIYFSYRLAGGSWSLNVKVNDDPGTADQYLPAIAVDASGNVYAVWYDYRNDNWDIYFSYRLAGGSWSANVRVDDDAGTASQSDPAIGVDSSGNVYAVWYDYRNDNWDIYFSYRPAGGSWSANVKVNDDSAMAYQGSPAIAVDSSGNAYAVWYDWRNVDPDIYFSYRPAGGGWGTNIKVNDDPDTAWQGMPSIGVDASGNAYAVWGDERNGDSDIYFSYRPAGGSWSANVRVNDDSGTTGHYSPAIAVDVRGNAYAVWEDYRNVNPDIYFSFYGLGWEPTFFVYLPIIMKNY